MIAAFVVLLAVLLGAAATLKQYNDIKPYKKLADELNQLLGGGYKTSYKWKCGLESTNCPSARMIKDANFADNNEAKTIMEGYTTKLKASSFSAVGFGICTEQKNIKVYCSVEAKKDGKVITINAKQDFVGIDVTP
jgi:uncharacterized protein YhjY with autotransporter beta-barrel domain